MSQPRRAVAFAPAKVNLFLHVVGRRADGYHLLESLVAFAGVGDVIAAAPRKRPMLAIDGPFAAALGDAPPADNLALRAVAAIDPDAGVGLRLTKRLPVASGIGGGSADAAAATRAALALWDRPPPPDLADRLLALGADVPVCWAGAACMMRGVGEALSPLPSGGVPPAPILLVNPGVGLSTPAVFKAREAPFSPSLTADWPATSTVDALIAALGDTRNDLEPPARAIAPAVGETLDLLARLDGVRLARMSGSGATCFALFDDDAAAARAQADVAALRPAWWSAATRLLDRPVAASVWSAEIADEAAF